MSVKISSLNTASTINSGDDINIAGNNPLTFSDWGGGWFMQDGTYIRSLNQKSIWLGDGVLASNGGLSVGYGGTLPTAGYAIIAGRLGVGTSDPQKVLDVAIGANNFVTVGAVTSMGIGQWAGIHFGYRENNALYRKSAIVFERTDNAGGGGNAAGKVYILNGPGIGAGSATLADAKLTIDEYGKVGIGTTTPGYLLDVNGNGRFNGSLTFAQAYGSNEFINGTGDGSSFTTYNFALSGWSSMAFYNPTVGGAYPEQVSGLVDFRNGIINMKGGFSVNGSVVLYAGNVGSYAVKLYGTINNNIDSDYGESFVTFDPVPSGTPPLSSPNIRTINVGNNYGRRTQLAFDYASDKAYFRRRMDSTWYAWVEFIHSGNIGSYLGAYLPLTAGSSYPLTGTLYGVAASFSSSVAASSLSANSVVSSTGFIATTAGGGLRNDFYDVRFYPSAGNIWNITGATLGGSSFALRFLDAYNAGSGAVKAQIFWSASNVGLFNDQNDWVIKANQGASFGGTLYGAWIATGSITASANSVISGAVNSAWGLQVINTGTTNANGLYVNIGASSTGVPFRVDKGGAALFDITNAGNATIKGDLTISGSDLFLNGTDVDISTKYNNGAAAIQWTLTTDNIFKLIRNGSSTAMEITSVAPLGTPLLNIYTGAVHLGLGYSSSVLVFNSTVAGNTWRINQVEGFGLSFQKGTVKLHEIDLNGKQLFYNISNNNLIGEITASGTSFGSTSGTYTEAYFHVTSAVGATNAMFGTTYPIALGGNYPGIYFNMYYNVGYRIAHGTGVYGAANTYDPINGIISWLVADTSGNEGVSVAIVAQLRLDRLGRVSIGTTASTSEKLYVGGTTFLGGATKISGTCSVSSLTINGALYSNISTVSGYGTLTTTNPSDIRLKEEVETLEYGLKEVMALKPVTYKWKNPQADGKRYTGLIAQDVQEIMPEYVSNISEDDDYLGLDSYAINIVLINAIKELQAKIEILEKNK